MFYVNLCDVLYTCTIFIINKRVKIHTADCVSKGLWWRRRRRWCTWPVVTYGVCFLVHAVHLQSPWWRAGRWRPAADR